MAISTRKVHSYDLVSGHAWYVPGGKEVFALLGMLILGAFLGGFANLIIVGILGNNDIGQYYGLVVSYPLQFLPVMVFAAAQSRKNMMFDTGFSLDSKHFSPYGMFVAILLTVLLAIASIFVFDLPNYWNTLWVDKLSGEIPSIQKLYDLVMEEMRILLSGPLPITFLVVAILPPIFEEWLCRGMVLRGLLTKMKPVWAIVISALFFAVIHANPWQALNAFLIGLLMGYVYYKTGSLILTMIMHFVNNGTAVILSRIDSLKDYDLMIDMLGKQDYTNVYIVSCIVLVACLWAFSRIKVENPWGNIDRIPPADEAVVEETPAEGSVPTEE